MQSDFSNYNSDLVKLVCLSIFKENVTRSGKVKNELINQGLL